MAWVTATPVGTPLKRSLPVFKAFGRALRMALAQDPAMAGVTPSTKGVL